MKEFERFRKFLATTDGRCWIDVTRASAFSLELANFNDLVI